MKELCSFLITLYNVSQLPATAYKLPCSQFNTDYLLQFIHLTYSQNIHTLTVLLYLPYVSQIVAFTPSWAVTVHCHNSRCLRPLILLTKLHILRAGPSFRPMYFIIMSEFNNSNALPSISCKNNQNVICRF